MMSVIITKRAKSPFETEMDLLLKLISKFLCLQVVIIINFGSSVSLFGLNPCLINLFLSALLINLDQKSLLFSKFVQFCLMPISEKLNVHHLLPIH